jgi:hypothetical protein
MAAQGIQPTTITVQTLVVEASDPETLARKLRNIETYKSFRLTGSVTKGFNPAPMGAR